MTEEEYLKSFEDEALARANDNELAKNIAGGIREERLLSMPDIFNPAAGFGDDPSLTNRSTNTAGKNSPFRAPSLDTSNPDLFKNARILIDPPSYSGGIDPPSYPGTNNLYGKPPTSLTESTERLTPLRDKVMQGLILTPEEQAEYRFLTDWESSTRASGDSAGFSNDLIELLLPQMFTQQYEQTQSDRRYNQEMVMYQDQQRAQEDEQNRELNDRKRTFKFAESLFPDIDLSGAGGELDPSMIPELVRYKMSQDSIKANKQNQVMAQPQVKFAV
jgi:hypothetical protein